MASMASMADDGPSSDGLLPPLGSKNSTKSVAPARTSHTKPTGSYLSKVGAWPSYLQQGSCTVASVWVCCCWQLVAGQALHTFAMTALSYAHLLGSSPCCHVRYCKQAQPQHHGQASNYGASAAAAASSVRNHQPGNGYGANAKAAMLGQARAAAGQLQGRYTKPAGHATGAQAIGAGVSGHGAQSLASLSSTASLGSFKYKSGGGGASSTTGAAAKTGQKTYISPYGQRAHAY